MEPDDLGQDKEFLDQIAISVRNIICATFPQATAAEREDIEQEVKLKIWKMASDGKKIGNFRSYLWRVVYTTTLDVLGGRMNAAAYSGDRPADDGQDIFGRLDLLSPEALIEKKELSGMLASAIDSLPRRRRLVINLYLAEMSMEEIADFLGWSNNKVVHLFYRGLGDLRREVRQRTKHPRLKALGFQEKSSVIGEE
ncbi:MAG: hypothetical protein A2W03_09815 [Candidatus Aminicenantes bacterium RBG_16_63_16]|nr:MAG: hypothetical protein A2W03_09815 [Candidatus Aminicenantes bacterium RBG_16_63_16]